MNFYLPKNSSAIFEIWWPENLEKKNSKLIKKLHHYIVVNKSTIINRI